MKKRMSRLSISAISFMLAIMLGVFYSIPCYADEQPASSSEQASPNGEQPSSHGEQASSDDPVLDQSDSPDSRADSSEEASRDQTQEFYASEITDEDISIVLDALQDGQAGEASALSLKSSSASSPVESFAGADRYEVAAKVALSAFSHSEYAIVAGGEGWADALAATSLAGALGCPILLTDATSLSPCTKSVLETLGVSKVLVVGGLNTVSASVADAISSLGASVQRLEGATRFEVQLNIYQYGLDRNLWANDLVVVASGTKFADALSASPIAYSKHVPIFLVDSNGNLNADQKRALVAGAQSGLFKESVIAGGEASVSRTTEGFMWGVSQLSSGLSKNAVRLGGANRYEASANIAAWAVERGYLSWNGAGFTTGEKPYDALSASAVQGTTGSVLLLVNDASNPTISKAVANKSSIASVKFFGGYASVSQSLRTSILVSLGISDIRLTDCSISLDQMANLEVAASVGYQNYTKQQILEYLDPQNFTYGDSAFLQFAVLTNGYSQATTAAQLDAFIAGNCGYSESNNGVTSILRGMGSTFIQAAQQVGVNEVYLLSHAILESGWGTSELARGYHYEGGYIDGVYYAAGTYYNFFGIGAYDSSPLSGGRKLAIINGWNTPEKAITGAASWVKRNYLANSYGPQDTLYKMKWDMFNAANSSSPWHQYATSRTWATGIAAVMDSFYSHAGISIPASGLAFDVPEFRTSA